MGQLAITGGRKVIDEVRTSKEWPGPKAVSPIARMFSEYCGAEYTIPFSAGTAALSAGLVAAGVGPGDEVIVPSFTWPASVNCVLHVNGIPVFADIDPRTFTIDPEDVKKKITDKTKAVIPVDMYGHPADIFKLMEIAESHDLIVLDVYHMYTCLYDEELIGVPRRLFVGALEAEGVPVVTYINSANWLLFAGGREVSVGPIHLRPVFQAKDLYGKGCPFQCPHGRMPDYDEGSLPVTERIVDAEFSIQQHDLSVPYTEERMQLYADAIEKVVENVNELRCDRDEALDRHFPAFRTGADAGADSSSR